MSEILPEDGFSAERYPRLRHATRDLLGAAARKHTIHATVEVDVSVTVERVVDGANQVVPTIVRAANRKSIREIHAEIRRAQTTPVERAGVFGSIRLSRGENPSHPHEAVIRSSRFVLLAE